jgi:serine-type D-Ala-D-Ala carboxypeptidase/endopeptidase
MKVSSKKVTVALIWILLLSSCGGRVIVPTRPDPQPSPPTTAWTAVTAAIDAASPQFPNGLTVEIATTAGVVYSHTVGPFTNATNDGIASGSKWVTATTILQLVSAGVLNLDEPMSSILKDRNGVPWTGNMGQITLRRLLSFTSGISGDDRSSDSPTITLEEAVNRIYDDQKATAEVPGSYFYYGDTHMRIAGRVAEIKTGKPWAQIFDGQIRLPFGWSAASIYSSGRPNPNLAGGLKVSGLEYMRFMMLQLRKGLDGTQRKLDESLITQQRSEQFLPNTVIQQSPYATRGGKQYHYGFGNWRECDTPDNVLSCDAALRISSTGTQGWAPWIDIQTNYAAIIMTRQGQAGATAASETLKATLSGLIPAELAKKPPVIRSVP